jgi:hypothetical protein
MYIPVNNPQDGDDNISSFDEDEAGCSFILASEGNVQDSAQNSPRDPLKQKGISVNFQLRPRFFLLHLRCLNVNICGAGVAPAAMHFSPLGLFAD